jgi:Trk-type K+ transport system membrane component
MLADFREKANLKLYNSKEFVQKLFTLLHVVVATSMIGVLVYYYGFPQTDESKSALIQIIEYSFGFYILRFLVRFIYDFNPRDFFRQRWFESLIILALLVEGIAYNVFHTLFITRFFIWLGFDDFTDVSNLFVQLFFVIYIATEIFRKRDFHQWLKIHPGLLFMFSILIIILIGTGLLMLPEMTIARIDMPFTDALFTSASSVSVTGLMTMDVSADFTFKGQLVIMFLIQIGGFNTIAFAALYLLVAKFGIGVKQHDIMEDFVNKDSILSTGNMFTKILAWTLVIEILGFALIFILVDRTNFDSNGDHFFFSLFHAISGFNNAGITTMDGGMMNEMVLGNYGFQIVILVLFFLGGMGMIYLFDLLEFKRIKERIRLPWKRLQFGTKITLYFTLILLIAGAIVFFTFEYSNTMQGESWVSKTITTFFQSMTTRNAGFNTVDIGSLALPTLVFFLFLMFVGAGSGSSGGGIRVSTFAIMFASVISTIRRKPNTELFKRTVSNDLVMKAYSIFIFFIVGNLVGIFGLVITESEAIESGAFSLMDILFEHVSAASTVGLSTGITSELSEAGKYIIIFAMFIGRVGTLTLAYLLGRQVLSKNYKYPSGHTMIG